MKLNQIPKKNIYQVPDGYFDRLPMQVMARTASKGATATAPAFTLWQSVRAVIAPLVLLVVFVSVYFLNVQEQPQQTETNSYTAHLAKPEIVDYLTSYARLETSDLEELRITNQDLASDFMDISPEMAEEELEYYRISNLTY